MRAISLWQPWASAMALGLKRIETRHWSTGIRGLVAIHAAKRWTRDERELAECYATIHNLPALGTPPLGAVVAIGELVRVVRVEQLAEQLTDTEERWGNYSPGRYGWVFSEVVGLAEPVPCKGAQGFFELSIDVTDAVLRQAATLPARDGLLL